MRHSLIAAIALPSFAVAATAVQAQRPRAAAHAARDEHVESRAFEWSGELGPGQRLILRSLNGSIQVERATGRNLEIVADKKWRKGTPADVKINASRPGGRDVLVCATWNPSTICNETQYNIHGRGVWDNSNNSNNDTEVQFTVKLPADANVLVETTNGGIEIVGASGSIDAHTTNGDVVAETSGGTVEAGTTNGDLDLRMPRLPAHGAAYQTTNGSIGITLPEGLEATIEARTTNGRVISDFPILASGSISNRNLHGTIGHGGPMLRLETTNGNVRIEKR